MWEASMENSNAAPAWRWALLPIEAIGLGLFLAICVWLAFAAIGFVIGLALGAESRDAFMRLFGSLPIAMTAFGFGSIRGVWSAKAVGGARTAIIAMATLFVAAIAIAALSTHPATTALASFAPLVGGVLYLANVHVGRSRSIARQDANSDV
jgi:hypothetical protein